MLPVSNQRAPSCYRFSCCLPVFCCTQRPPEPTTPVSCCLPVSGCIRQTSSFLLDSTLCYCSSSCRFLLSFSCLYCPSCTNHLRTHTILLDHTILVSIPSPRVHTIRTSISRYTASPIHSLTRTSINNVLSSHQYPPVQYRHSVRVSYIVWSSASTDSSVRTLLMLPSLLYDASRILQLPFFSFPFFPYCRHLHRTPVLVLPFTPFLAASASHALQLPYSCLLH